MKKFLIYSNVITFLFFLCAAALGQSDPRTELLQLPTLKVNKELKDIPEAKKLLQQAQQISELIEREMKREDNDEDYYTIYSYDSLDVEIIRILVRLIQEYPNSKFALTAKLRLADIVFEISPVPEYLIVAGKLYDEIITEFPDTWQGKLALVGKASYFEDMNMCTESITLINTHFDKIKSLDNIKDSDFHWYKQKVIGFENSDKIEAAIRGLLIVNYCLTEDYENAKIEGEYIIRNYPTQTGIDSLKEDLEMIKKHKSPYGVIKNGKRIFTE